MKPRLLDLFCGAGGAAMGYHRAGFEVVGVDINPQPHYPFRFIQADALTFLRDVDRGVLLRNTDAIHASPPCQAYSNATYPTTKARYPMLIAPLRKELSLLGLPYVIENVVGAAPYMNGSLMLCGSMFELAVKRHRLFESSEFMWAPDHHCSLAIANRAKFPAPEHLTRRSYWNDGKEEGRAYGVTGESRGKGCLPFWAELMDMPWATTTRDLVEAIPPAYTEWIGRQLLAALERAA